jgi:hypothetical protein
MRPHTAVNGGLLVLWILPYCTLTAVDRKSHRHFFCPTHLVQAVTPGAEAQWGVQGVEAAVWGVRTPEWRRLWLVWNKTTVIVSSG